MVDEKKSSSSSSWAKVEPVAVGLGTWSWLIALASAAYSLGYGIYVLSWGYYWTSGSGVWLVIQGGVTLVLIFIYVLKPFSACCKAKEWEKLIAEKTKMWVFAILLVVFSYWGAAGVIIPAILLTFVRK